MSRRRLRIFVSWSLEGRIMKRTIEVLLVVLALVGGYPTRVGAQGLSTPTPLIQRGGRPATQTATAPASLMAAYAMSNTLDASGNNRTAVFTDMSTVSGKYAEGQNFNGNSSHMVIPNITFTNAFTLEAWVRLTQNTRSVVGMRTPREGGPAYWQAIVYKSLDAVFLAEAGGFITAGFTPQGASAVQVVAPTSITPNVWHHVASTYDGATLALIVDGVQVASRGVTGQVSPSSNPLEVGGSTFDAGVLGGTIDDVRIYGRGLSASEVASDMATPVDVVREDVVSWDIEVFSKDAPTRSGGTAIASANFLRSAAVCNLAPLTPPAGTVQNPTTMRVSDPAASGKECEIVIESFILGLPAGVGYTSTARARGVTTAADRSPASNPFDRVTCHCR